ncbi:MAG: chromosome segregation protein SMC [Gammaproteobacteria bacterium]|nr:chromosome segregation protein SMC [Gammaproteobacteria bacterium]
MRLKLVKLSGFKSFVDPTSVPVTSNLIGVVGPNGCGKSNIIDAVRWVMGESSAKNLRGDSMADVIFSGSNTRKPVGKASVELIFDNSDGRAPGQYAGFGEISIRREASRDGTSDYFLNKARCRKKDITDLFLGTGLGPRAYSIIEQGMVTRIVEAKPEDLRGFLEEAAGISKYKERRRETENRIRHARENLERVQDIRQELETQLRKLDRQSKAAVKYKEYKQEERLVKGQLLSLRWKKLDNKLGEFDRLLAQYDNEREAIIARQREAEAQIEALRSEHTEANDALAKVQEEYYALGADISGVEQKIQHARQTREQQLREQEQVNRAWEEASQHLTQDKQQVERLTGELAELEPLLQEVRSNNDSQQQARESAEQKMNDWQHEWQRFNAMAAEPEKTRDVQRSRIQQTEQHLESLKQRQSRLGDEAASIDTELAGEDLDGLRSRAAELDRQSQEHESQLESVNTRVRELREQLDEDGVALEEHRGQAHTMQARLASLQELQDAAQGKHDEALNKWLGDHGLEQAPRLASMIEVEAGWEKAAERVLALQLSAVRVDSFSSLAADAATLETDLVMVDGSNINSGAIAADSLLHKVKADVSLAPWLAHVRVADNLEAAMARRNDLAAHESIITRDGAWLGANWLSIVHPEGARAGMLRRQREMDTLTGELARHEAEIQRLEAEQGKLRHEVQELDQQRESLRRTLNEHNQKRTEAHAALGSKEARLSNLTERRQKIADELAEIGQQLTNDAASLEEARKLLGEAESMSGSLEQRREELQARRNQYQQQLEQVRADAARARDLLQEREVERQRMTTLLEQTRQSVERLEKQLQQLISRRDELNRTLANTEDPATGLNQQRETLLHKRQGVEEQLTGARRHTQELEAATREQEKNRAECEQEAQELRGKTEEQRLARQETSVRRDTIAEQVAETGNAVKDLLEAMPEEASEASWTEELDKIGKRITRLGPINLVAIEEFEEQSERKTYIDKQYDDLTQALQTLEEAMGKIDKETRTRFKETFDKVNTGLQALFPRLFGGGHAYLELTGEDLLDTGVSIMARPPGKRNSTIHLLSGGEKALTAVSLIFSIFQLNPAPFCLLDEVDAPLDDANVERYSKTLIEMAAETQLMFITHNKITMEIADLLLGVTMSEPGVSRLVSVDVEEAMEMVG